MSEVPETRRKLPRIGPPAVRGVLHMEPVVPLDGPVTEGPLIHVRRPVVRGSLTFERVENTTVEPATLEAVHPAGAPQGEGAFGVLRAFVGKVNEAEQLYNRPGVRIDAERSGVRDGKVVIVLAPNDPTDAVETCKRVADYLFAGIRTIPGATVRVLVAGQPDATVYELAS